MNDLRRKGYEMEAEILQSLAHPIRLAIADLLRRGERCVQDIAETVGAERSNVSRHLALMLKTGVVKTRKQGQMVMYSLRCACLLDALACASEAARQRTQEDMAALGA
ncbi:MAG: metalloregulator ArsR/SmtB family transcription factor [Phycisphaeraceae bacterium]